MGEEQKPYVLHWGPVLGQKRRVVLHDPKGSIVAQATIDPDMSLDQTVADLRQVGYLPSNADYIPRGDGYDS